MGKGWTMAGMIIRYKLRERREREEAARARAASAWASGTETAREAGRGTLVVAAAVREEGTTEARTGAVGAVYVPSDESMGAARARSEEAVFWGADATGHGEGGMGQLMEWMDDAGIIVAYDTGGWAESMREAYGGDAERRQAHLAKMIDVGEHVRTRVGRAVRESTFLRANGQSRHAGTRCDVDGNWERGRIEVIRDACMRDARALAEVALAHEMRGPDGCRVEAVARARAAVIRGGDGAAEGTGASGERQQHTTRDGASGSNDGGRERGAGGDGASRKRGAPARAGTDGRRVRAGRGAGGAAPEAGAAERSEAGATAAEEQDAARAAAITTPQRPKRKEGPTAPTYVHTRQYRKRQKSESYMLRNGHSAVLSKRAVEVGPATVERTADGRYDWQDGRLRKRRRESTAGGDGERRLRPRDPGRGDGPPPP